MLILVSILCWCGPQLVWFCMPIGRNRAGTLNKLYSIDDQSKSISHDLPSYPWRYIRTDSTSQPLGSQGIRATVHFGTTAASGDLLLLWPEPTSTNLSNA
ncbi:hypothetical protein EV426DRAFT_590356 [Tirmania nivea]|nr:hypothetical protein EV426DRAFT_590356 [Tirmania nivea]